MLNIFELIEDAIIGFFNSILNGTTDKFSDILNNALGFAVQDYFEIGFIKDGIKYAQLLALALVLIKVLVEGACTYYLEISGDSEASVSLLMKRTVVTIVTIISIPTVVKEMFNFGKLVCDDIAAMGINSVKDFTDVLTLFSNGSIVILILLILTVVFGLCITIQSLIRGAELVRGTAIGPILALSLISNNHQAFQTWFKQIIVICLSQAMQLFMLKASMAIRLEDNAISILLFLSWLIVVVKTPKWLEAYTYSSGMGSTLESGARQMGSMYIMRKVMR